jgi:hypothetical protein
METSKDKNEKQVSTFVFGIVLVSGLVSGMIINTSFETFFDSPVKSALKTVVGGFGGMLSAGIVSAFLPDPAKIIVPLLLAGLTLAHLKK